MTVSEGAHAPVSCLNSMITGGFLVRFIPRLTGVLSGSGYNRSRHTNRPGDRRPCRRRRHQAADGVKTSDLFR